MVSLEIKSLTNDNSKRNFNLLADIITKLNKHLTDKIDAYEMKNNGDSVILIADEDLKFIIRNLSILDNIERKILEKLTGSLKDNRLELTDCEYKVFESIINLMLKNSNLSRTLGVELTPEELINYIDLCMSLELLFNVID